MTGVRAYGRAGVRWVGAAAMAVALAAVSGPAEAQETSISIYENGSAFVRRSFASPLVRGASTHRLDVGLPTLDPGALVSLDDGVVITSARIRSAVGREATMQRALGREIEFLMFRGDSMRFTRGTLLSLSPPAVRVAGRVMFTVLGEPAFPESLVQLTPSLELGLESPRALPAIRLGYFADGLSWRASFVAVVPRVGGGPATVSGTATIDNAALTLQGATVQLVSGEVRRAQPLARRPMAGQQRGLEGYRLDAITVTMAAQPDEEAVAEARVYTIPARVDFEPGVAASTPLFAPLSAEVDREFLVTPRGGIMEQWIDRADSNVHPDVAYRLRRPEESAFGDIALPGGVVRVFAPDTAGRLQLLGEAGIGQTPRGRDVWVTTGTAADVIADKVQTLFERRGDRDVIVGYRIRVRNGKDESITVRVREQFPGGRWEVLNSTVPVERASAFVGEFRLPVPARSEATLEYRVRVRW